MGVLLDNTIAPDVVVSQGCRPIGEPFIVTRAERSVIFELGGRPALERLIEIVDGLGPDERALAARGLHCGVVVDEYKATFERGDFLIRGVLGADRDAQAIAVGDEVPVGATIQFQVRDAETAGEDLIGLLSGHEADAALVFTCNGRGAAMFGDADHDPSIVQERPRTPARRRHVLCRRARAGGWAQRAARLHGVDPVVHRPFGSARGTGPLG